MVAALATWFPHGGGCTDELGKILIRSNHVGVDAPALIGAVGDGADDVVCFVAVEFKHGYAEGVAKFFDQGDGLGEFFRHGLSLSFVFRVEDVA